MHVKNVTTKKEDYKVHQDTEHWKLFHVRSTFYFAVLCFCVVNVDVSQNW